MLNKCHYNCHILCSFMTCFSFQLLFVVIEKLFSKRNKLICIFYNLVCKAFAAASAVDRFLPTDIDSSKGFFKIQLLLSRKIHITENKVFITRKKVTMTKINVSVTKVSFSTSLRNGTIAISPQRSR